MQYTNKWFTPTEVLSVTAYIAYIIRVDISNGLFLELSTLIFEV